MCVYISSALDIRRYIHLRLKRKMQKYSFSIWVFSYEYLLFCTLVFEVRLSAWTFKSSVTSTGTWVVIFRSSDRVRFLSATENVSGLTTHAQSGFTSFHLRYIIHSTSGILILNYIDNVYGDVREKWEKPQAVFVLFLFRKLAIQLFILHVDKVTWFPRRSCLRAGTVRRRAKMFLKVHVLQ